MDSDGNESIVEIGAMIEVIWENRKCICRVTSTKKAKKPKKNSLYIYTLNVENSDKIIVTRLNHLDWKVLKGFDSDNSGNSDNRISPPISNMIKTRNIRSFPRHTYILAPMVGASELPFCLLCRRYGAQLAYTPMINSEKFAIDESYRQQEFQSVPEDRPLVAHFSANDPHTLLAAARHIEHKCDAIDLNLGCPQRVAYTGHFGSYLLDECDRQLVIRIVETLAINIAIPVFVKIRLLEDFTKTLQLCQQLADAGAALIAIHARYRVNLVGRSGPGARDGPAHLDQVAKIKRIFVASTQYKHVKIIANGNVTTWDDVKANIELTGSDGIMSAEGILDDPAIYYPAIEAQRNFHAELNDSNQVTKKLKLNELRSTKPSKVQLAKEYLELVELHPATLKTVIFHLRRMCRDEFTKYEMMEDCLMAKTIEELKAILCKVEQYELQGGFQLDLDKIAKAKEAVEKLKRQESRRKEFEKRMIRKAKREGKPLDYYLLVGAAIPTISELEDLRNLSYEDSFRLWKDKHSQHCYAYHIYHYPNMKRCDRDRTCAFLHTDPTFGEEKEVFG